MMAAIQTKYPRKFRMVMTPRTIRDLAVKMQKNRDTPQDQLIDLFFDLCDWGLDVYVQSEQERFPHTSRAQILKEMYERRGKSHSIRTSSDIQ